MSCPQLSMPPSLPPIFPPHWLMHWGDGVCVDAAGRAYIIVLPIVHRFNTSAVPANDTAGTGVTGRALLDTTHQRRCLANFRFTTTRYPAFWLTDRPGTATDPPSRPGPAAPARRLSLGISIRSVKPCMASRKPWWALEGYDG